MLLESGSRVAFSGHFLSVDDLLALAGRAGLLVDEAVTEATDLLVSNDAGSGSPAVRSAIALGTPIVDEYVFGALVG